ncbi:MAG: hypothetical protein ACJAWV_003279 [Flammeovirgaceae bacterium]|jgi:hypothetical protein
MNETEWLGECNKQFAKIGWKSHDFHGWKNIEPVPKVRLFLVLPLKDELPNNMLNLTEFGVIGLVKNRKVLDQNLLKSFHYFLTNGYEADNYWWKQGVFDKMAKFGFLIKKGKKTLTKSYFTNPTSPIYILGNEKPEFIAEAVLEAEKIYQKKLSANQTFATTLQNELAIELYPDLSDVGNMHFRLKTRSGNYGENEPILQQLRNEAFLVAFLAFQQFPNKQQLAILFRNNFLDGDRFLVENSKLHIFQVSKSCIKAFSEELFGELVEFEKVPEFAKNDEISEKVAFFVQKYETERMTSSRPIDK